MNKGERKAIRRLSWVNILLGLWIIISPFALGFDQLQPALRNNIGAGLGIFFFALLRVSSIENQPIWSWCTGLLGLWLSISPFLLGFAHPVGAMLNDMITGALVTVIAFTNAHMTEPQKATAPGRP